MRRAREIIPPRWWTTPPEREEPERYKCRVCGCELDRLGYAADENLEYVYCSDCLYHAIAEGAEDLEEDFLKQLIWEDITEGANYISFENLYKER